MPLNRAREVGMKRAKKDASLHAEEKSIEETESLLIESADSKDDIEDDIDRETLAINDPPEFIFRITTSCIH